MKCCLLTSVPVAFTPTEEFQGNEDSSSGIYCPTGLEKSGRPNFSQLTSSNTGETDFSGTITYDRKAGKWCIGATCLASDAVHPLDLGPPALGDYYLAPLRNFDSKFQGQGAVLATTRAPPQPRLPRFSAQAEADVSEECQEEYNPAYWGKQEGESVADLQGRMNTQAATLDDEHPCRYVSSEGEGGLAYDSGLGDAAPPPGVTYRSVQGCFNRQGDRDGRFDKFSRRLGVTQTLTNFGFDQGITASELFKELTPDLFGGIADNGWDTLIATLKTGSTNFGLGFDVFRAVREGKYAEASGKDCISEQHAFARTFCDLFCLRDAVKTGDAQIVEVLEKAVNTLQGSMQDLFEFYLADRNVDEQGALISTGISRSLAEMQDMVRDASLHPMDATATTRGIREFLAELEDSHKSVHPEQTSRGNLTSRLLHLETKARNTPTRSVIR